MDEKKVRYTAHLHLHVADRLFPQSMVIDCHMSGGSGDELIRKAVEQTKGYIGTMGRTMITEKMVLAFIEDMKADGWGERRIRNHLQRFDVEIPTSSPVSGFCPRMRALDKEQKRIDDVYKPVETATEPTPPVEPTKVKKKTIKKGEKKNAKSKNKRKQN